MPIFETTPYGTPSASNIFCGFAWKANTIYRQLQATTTTEPRTGSVDRVLPTNQNSSVLSNPVHHDLTTTTTSTTAASQTSQSPTPTMAPTKGSSKAWISGAVIGPLAGVAIVAALIFWWIYRRKQNRPKQNA
ncbi:hypothetical protein N7501_004894 [Penicillium viridicatum]|nr:hypothetical protein N7501_004894 [Penicillium viridicatum]